MIIAIMLIAAVAICVGLAVTNRLDEFTYGRDAARHDRGETDET